MAEWKIESRSPENTMQKLVLLHGGPSKHISESLSFGTGIEKCLTIQSTSVTQKQ